MAAAIPNPPGKSRDASVRSQFNHPLVSKCAREQISSPERYHALARYG